MTICSPRMTLAPAVLVPWFPDGSRTFGDLGNRFPGSLTVVRDREPSPTFQRTDAPEGYQTATAPLCEGDGALAGRAISQAQVSGTCVLGPTHNVSATYSGGLANE